MGFNSAFKGLKLWYIHQVLWEIKHASGEITTKNNFTERAFPETGNRQILRRILILPHQMST